MSKCLAIDRNSNRCRCNALLDTRFCKNHSYMVEYTDEMLEQLSICTGCKKSYYIPEGKTCSTCRERGKKNKLATRENVVLCANDKCVFKRSEENKYCQKHQICVFVDDTVVMGKKVCKQYVRGCRSQLDLDYQYARCQNCLEKEREQDRARRGKSRLTENTQPNKQTCTTCCKTYDTANFIGQNGGITKTCSLCREACKVQDLKRDKEHRNEFARIAEQKPQRKEVKQQWNENNYEKVAMKSMNYRQRQIETDIEEYLNKNAENAKQWRDRNPEKVADNNLNKKNSITLQYGVYMRSARDKRLTFELTNDDFDTIVKTLCYYCGTFQDKGFNGIDRKNSEIGYVEGNCVSCCKMCNYMKGSLSEDAFLGRIEHILTYNGKIEGGLFPEMFADYNGGASKYTEYKKRAHRKNLDFMLSQDMFNNLICKPCYICGKKSSSDHMNGIDRIDNHIGYTLDNGIACCGGCNYMKRNYSLEDVFDKYQNVYTYNIMQRIVTSKNEIVQQTLDDIIEQVEKRTTTDIIAVVSLSKSEKNREYQRRYREKIITEQGIEVLRTKEREKKKNNANNDKVTNKNKKTEEEKREDGRIRKQQQRLRLREKYGDEEYKKLRSQELAQYRNDKKTE